VAGRFVHICALALALGAGGEALAARIVDPASARLAISTPAVATRDAELAALAAAGRATELAARLELIARDPALSDVARDWLLDRGLHALARLAPTGAARAAVARLALRKPVVYTRVDPDHGDRGTPFYDTGATARFVARSWDRSAARAAAQGALAARSARAVLAYAGETSAPHRAGIADAFRAASPAELASQRAAVAGAIAAGQRVDTLALILAERLADRELFNLVVDYADGPEALAAVAAVSRSLDPASALATLGRASRRADIASAAVLEAGRLAARDGAARSFLFGALADPGTAPSAAAALGGLGDPLVSAEIGRRLAQAQADGERRLLVLALELDGSAAARAELERFAKSGKGSPQLRAKLDRWLGR
jgi:hypothetical protein